MSVSVLGPDGDQLMEEVHEEIRRELTDKAMAGLHIHVGSPQLVPVRVEATVIANSGTTSGAVQEAVEAALRLALSPDRGAWAATIHSQELAAIVTRVPGVAWVQSLQVATTGAFNDSVSLPDSGYGALPTSGAFSVVVVGNE